MRLPSPRNFFVTPIYFFGWVGFLLFLTGALCGMGALALWGGEGTRDAAMVLAMLAPTLSTLGLVEVTLGIIAEVLIRMHFELQGKEPYRVSRTRNLGPREE